MNYTKGVTTRLYLGHHGCGCFIFKEDGKVFIEYCPKHKAAPDMYEALKMITRGERRDGNYTRQDAIAFLGLAQKALAKVDNPSAL